MRRALLMTMTLILAVAGVVAMASSGNAGATIQPLSVNPTSGPPGSSLTVSGGACPAPNEAGAGLISPLNLLGDPLVVGTDSPDAGGNWQVSLTIPANATPGVYIVVADCFPPNSAANFRGQSHVAGLPIDYVPASFTVTPAAVPTPPPTPVVSPLSLSGPAEPITSVPSFTG